MASVSFRFSPAVQSAQESVLSEQSNPASVASSISRSRSSPSNAGRGGAAPQDNVTISHEPAAALLAKPNQGQPELVAQRKPLVQGETAIGAHQLNPTSQINSVQGASAGVPSAGSRPIVPQAPDSASAASGHAASSPGANPTAGSAPNTASSGAQAQKIAQLDQILRSLGIAPQSISQSNQRQLLLYLDDPTALRRFVQQLQGGRQVVVHPTLNVTA
jgi:hypothetical protein